MILPGPELFPTAADIVYLDSAAEGLPPPGMEQAFAAYVRDKSTGTPGRRRLHAVEAETRGLAAALLGTAPDNVAFLSSASEAFTSLAGSLGLAAGDRIVISDIEFPSNVIPWLRLRDDGIDVHVVRSRGGAVALDDILAAITPRTRLVSLSLVSYVTGALLPDFRPIAAAAHRVDAVFCVDATQGLGRVPLCLDGVDYLMSSSFKWLLGPHGLGIVYVAPALRARLDPRAIGWYSVPDCFTPDRFSRYALRPGAACLSSGMPNFAALYALRSSLQFLEAFPAAAIHDALRPLVARIHAGCTALGLDLLTPADPALASGIVSFAHAQAAAIGRALERRGIIVWAGDGRVRAAVHLYNTDRHVDSLLAALSEILAAGGFDHE